MFFNEGFACEGGTAASSNQRNVALSLSLSLKTALSRFRVVIRSPFLSALRDSVCSGVDFDGLELLVPPSWSRSGVCWSGSFITFIFGVEGQLLGFPSADLDAVP